VEEVAARHLPTPGARKRFDAHAASTSGPPTPERIPFTIRASGSAPGCSCGFDLRPSNTRADSIHHPGLRLCAWLLMRLRPPALQHPGGFHSPSGPPALRLARHVTTITLEML